MSCPSFPGFGSEEIHSLSATEIDTGSPETPQATSSQSNADTSEVLDKQVADTALPLGKSQADRASSIICKELRRGAGCRGHHCRRGHTSLRHGDAMWMLTMCNSDQGYSEIGASNESTSHR